ncbi:hypothetical protein [Curtobacterium sp. ISL-83]|uniref:hypothetical protein n=1 Tax=Curtobacterium sp. ISL-83 TaxID=2819145 RepID=UPI001BE9D3D4|nr:hypothetical protein [Curtobacterium sp. ISL-83]MBT2502970.1 hypothetical protein [Curtobacterium sp. ISL-83]
MTETAIVSDGENPSYPGTTVGMLMQQRDSALGSAASAREAAARYLQLASDNEARAAGLQEAIDAMGGDQPMLPADPAPGSA